MTPQEYIASGILEIYALGSASPAEMQEVEMMVSKYPEVKKALDEICEGIENYATLHAVEPDEKVKQKILSASFNSNSKNRNSDYGNIISINAEKFSWFRNIAIAASVMLVISVGYNISQWLDLDDLRSDNKHGSAQFVLTKDSLKNIALLQQKTISERDSILHVLDFIRNPMTQNIILNSIVDGHPMKAIVHWDMQTMQVAIDPMTLPKTDSNDKYVLWAVIDGKAVNEGGFSVSDGTGIVMMNTIPKAEAFAISLEKSIDVPQHVGPIYVLGKPSSPQP